VTDPSTATTAAANKIKLIPADTIEPKAVRWAERGWIPLGAVTLVAGRKGEGKSTLMYDRLASATCGLLDGDLPGPVDVLVATAEDHLEQVATPRLIAANAVLGRVHFVKVEEVGYERDLNFPDDLERLRERIKEANARILFVDPLVAHMPAAIDAHKDQHVRRVLAPLTHIAEELDIAVVGTIHFNKSIGVTDALTRISGSGGFVNAARSVLCCATDPDYESRRLFWREISNLAPGRIGRSYTIEARVIQHGAATITTSGIEWLEDDVDVDSHRIMAGPGAEHEPSADIEEAKWLLDCLLTDRTEIDVKEARRAGAELGISQKTMQRAGKKMGLKTQRVGGVGDRGRWVLQRSSLSGHPPTGSEAVHLDDSLTAEEIPGPEPSYLDTPYGCPHSGEGVHISGDEGRSTDED
jgi:archaellum biogenesis ATPase FlaH